MSTPYATIVENGDGSKVEFNVTFDFIERDHVEVYRVVAATGLDTELTVIKTGAPTGDQYVWESNSKIKVGTAPTTEEQLKIVRNTPESDQIVKWADGSYIIAEDLNVADRQFLYGIQELEDKVGSVANTALKFLGVIDLTVDQPTTEPVNGNLYINSGNGNVTAGWAGLEGNPVVGGEQVIYNGTLLEWQIGSTPSSQVGVLSVTGTSPIVVNNTNAQLPVVELDESQLPAGTVVSDIAPTDAKQGELWFNTADNRLYIWTGSEWIDTSPEVAGGTNINISGTAANPVVNLNDSIELTGSTPDPFRIKEGNATSVNITQNGEYLGRVVKAKNSYNGIPDEDCVSFQALKNSSAVSFEVKADGKTKLTSVEFPDGTIQTTAGGGGGGVGEAPIDGQQYARQDADWSVVTGGGGGDINYNGASAWAQWNGQNSNGVCLLNGALNIASITRNTKGVYDVLFTSPMPDANYSIQVTSTTRTNQLSLITPTGFTITFRSSNDLSDANTMCLAVFATNALPPKGGTGTDAWAYVGSNATLESSFNIESVTKNGTGTYDFVFQTPMPTANYAITASSSQASTTINTGAPQTKNGFRIVTQNASGSANNAAVISVSVNASNAQLPDTVTQEQIEAAINNPGVSAWGAVDANGVLLEGLNASVSRLDVGTYKVTFITPMPSANYAVLISGQGGESDVTYPISATGFTYRVQSGSALQDLPSSFAVFATNSLPPKGGTGTDAWGSVQSDGTLDASFNIDSVTKSSTGTYDVVFTTAMPTANYSVTGSPEGAAGASALRRCFQVGGKTTSGFVVYMTGAGTGDYTNIAFDFQVNATNAQLPDTFTAEEIQSVIDANPKGIAKAWVNFDGSTMVTRDSFNVDSVVDNGTGNYTVNFATPFANLNYVPVITTIQRDDNSQSTGTPGLASNGLSDPLSQMTAGSVTIAYRPGGAGVDSNVIGLVVFSS